MLSRRDQTRDFAARRFCRPPILPREVFRRFAAMAFWGKGDSLAHFIVQSGAER